MPFILRVYPHLTPEALVERFKACKDAGERLRLQALMLKSEGWSAKAIADICKRRRDWVRRTVHVYNDGGPEALEDGRRDNGREQVLGVAECEQLSAALLQPPPDGGLWTSSKVSSWIDEHHGVAVSPHTAWAYMVRTGHSRQVPRPKHPDADLEAQEAFKIGWLKIVFETSFEPTPPRKSRSGPRTRFAHEQALPVSAFCRCVQAFDEEAGAAPKFLPVRVVAPEAPAPTELVVELAGVGHRIHVPADFDVAALQRLVGALC